jgi:serine/threonine protein kinase
MQAGLATGPTNADTVFAPLASDPLAPAEIARHFPQLEILVELGRGGMGVVYKARQKQLDRIVALKVLPPEAGRDPNFAERFLREARALAKLNHPGIVTVYEFGECGGLFFLIMEFVDGTNLRQLEQSHRLTPAEALAIIPKICDALQYAHEEGVVHRDIKPENILVDKRGRVKIADFGLAKLLGQTAADARLTRSNLMMGTPHYMAPEQMEKPLAVDHRADIYSLGVVFYELLTGELPLGRFQPPSSCGRGMQIDVRLDEVVLKTLEKEPERRYQQVSEVKTAVETVAQTPPPAVPSKPPSRRKLLLPIAAVAALMLVVGLFAFGNRFFGKSSPAVTAAPAAATSETHFNYTTNNGTITITKYTGPGGAVTIPSTINGLPVNSIGDNAFNGCSSLSGVTIPDGVTSIGSRAFISCSGLASITIPNSVTSMGGQVFWGCSGLTNITIPDSVTSITFQEFCICSRLTHFYLPKSITSIEWSPFAGCSSLTSIEVDAANPAYSSHDEIVFDKTKTKLVCCPPGKIGSYVIPNGVKSIMQSAFESCSLTGVRIPNSVTNIELHPFLGCRELNSIVVDAANPAYSDEDGVLFNKDKTSLIAYPPGKAGHFEVPNGVTTISPEAFRECSYLTSATIPVGVGSIGTAAFVGCENLTAIYFKGNAPRLDKEVFEGSKKATIYYQPGTTGWGPEFGGRPTAPWNPQTSNANTPATTPPPPFNYTTNNGTITITKYTGPGGAVTIPSTINGLSVTGIGENAFKGCTSLTSVTFPNSVTSIGHDAFAGCSGLTRITIPSSITSITGNPFPSCSGLIWISVDASNPAYSNNADGVVFDKKNSCLLICPGGTAGSYAVPNHVTRIGECAFNSCGKLTRVTIPNSVTKIEGFAFWCCSTLTNVTMGNNVADIGEGAFGYCRSLATVAIPGSVTSISSQAFRDCENLAAIHFKGDAPKLEKDVFVGCNKTTVYYQPGTKGWGPEFGGRPTAPWNPDSASTESRPSARP